jgi:hypothetical membrane protein
MSPAQNPVSINYSHSSKRAFKFWLSLSVALAIIGVLHFLGSTAVAMAHFPEGYSFEVNFLSDLGRSSMKYSDWYNFTLILLGVSLYPLFLTLILVDPRDSLSMKLAAGFGMLSATGLIGLGMTPIDKFFVLHYLALGVWLFPMFYTVITFYYGAARSSLAGVGFIALSLLMVVTMLIVLLRTEVSSFQILQKIIVVCGIVWLMYIVGFIYQSGRIILKSMKEPDLSRLEAEDSYFSEMYRQKAAKERRG